MLAKTVGVKHLVILVNKMDDPTVCWSEERWAQRSAHCVYTHTVCIHLYTHTHTLIHAYTHVCVSLYACAHTSSFCPAL